MQDLPSTYRLPTYLVQVWSYTGYMGIANMHAAFLFVSS